MPERPPTLTRIVVVVLVVAALYALSRSTPSFDGRGQTQAPGNSQVRESQSGDFQPDSPPIDYQDDKPEADSPPRGSLPSEPGFQEDPDKRQSVEPRGPRSRDSQSNSTSTQVLEGTTNSEKDRGPPSTDETASRSRLPKSANPQTSESQSARTQSARTQSARTQGKSTQEKSTQGKSAPNKSTSTQSLPTQSLPTKNNRSPYVLENITIRDRDRDVIYQGRIDLRETIARIEAGDLLKRFPHDGTVFQNRERRLPQKEPQYYREYVHPTDGVSGPGPQRIVTGKNGEIYYTPDHYSTFKKLK